MIVRNRWSGRQSDALSAILGEMNGIGNSIGIASAIMSVPSARSTRQSPERLNVRCVLPKKQTEQTESAERRAKRERYIFRRSNGLCVDCGEKAVENKCRCVVCGERNKDTLKDEYWFFVKMGICTKCGKYTAAPGRRKCEVCLAKDAESHMKRRESQGNKNSGHAEYMKRKREEARENGICRSCLKRKVMPGWSMCHECASKNRRKLRELHREQGHVTYTEAIENGLCTCCRHERSTHGKLCDTCYEKSMLKLEKAMQSKKTLEYRERMRRENEAIFALNRASRNRRTRSQNGTMVLNNK